MLAYLLNRVASETAVISETNGPSVPDLGVIRDLLAHQPEKNWSLDRLARRSGYSPFYLLRSFRESFHETPHRFLMRCRIDKARQLLSDTGLSVTEICLAVGFESVGSFSSLFRRRVGWPPSVYRARVLAQRGNPLKFIPDCHVRQYGL